MYIELQFLLDIFNKMEFQAIFIQQDLVPEFRMAMGRVRTPIPMLPFTRWIIVSKLEIEFSESRSSSSWGSRQTWVAIQLSKGIYKFHRKRKN